MPTPATPSAPAPKGDNRPLVSVDETAIAPSFEERLRIFWTKNSTAVTVVLVAVVVAIVAKGGWDYIEAQKETGIEQAYAAASTPAAMKSFAAAHADHPLAGAIQLRLADDAYAAGQFAEAITAYEQAVATLKAGPLASRARLGLAMAKLQGGRAADGEAALKALAGDVKEIKAYRAEAAYHLTSHAAATGNAADVKTYSEQLMQIDAASPWTQRALQLRAATPSADTATAPAANAPAIKLTGK